MSPKPAAEAFILRSDGSITHLPLREPTLEEMQKAVGGYIEVLNIRWLDRPAMMILDEDGKRKGRQMNVKATYTALTTSFIADDDFIVGDVVILVGKEVMLT
jgi:Domain of unknown function (DUF3846)